MPAQDSPAPVQPIRGDAAMAKSTKRGAARGKGAAKTGSNAALRAVIDELVVGNHILYDQEVVDGYGHISVRDPRDPQRFLMSRARAPGIVEAGDIMLFGLDGEVMRRDDPPVSTQRGLHAAVHRA